MIYLFAGDDTNTKQKAYKKFMKSIPGGREIVVFNKNDFIEEQIESYYSGVGLFSSKSLIICLNFFESREILDFILSKLDLISLSTNDFLFLEGHLNKPILEAFKGAGAEINIYDLAKEKKEKFNNFLLANALGAKDKLNLWIYFRQAVDKGVGLEELVGVLFWKAKDMLLKRNYGGFKETELENFANKISYLLPESRKLGFDDESAFEQFLLEAF